LSPTSKYFTTVSFKLKLAFSKVGKTVNPDKFKKVYEAMEYGYNTEGEKINKSVRKYIIDKLYDIHQLYIWCSKYKSKERLAIILNK
jgi:hypothetical protein